MARQPRKQRYIKHAELSDLLHQAPAAIAVMRGPEHEFALVNAYYQKLFNRHEEDLIGRRLRDVFPELVGQKIYVMLDKAHATGQSYVAHELLISLDRSNSGVRQQSYFNFVIKPIKSSHGAVESIYVQGIEVTEQVEARRIAERSLTRVADNEKQLKLITDSMPALVSYIDSDQRYQFINARYLDWFNRPEEDIIGKPVQEIVGDEPYQRARPSIEAALKGEKTTYSNSLRKHNGEIAYVHAEFMPDIDDTGKVRGVTVVAYDITGRVQADEQLKESEERLRFMAESMPQKIFTLDPEGDVDYCNPQWVEYSGLPVVEILGNGWQTLLSEADRENTTAQLRLALRTGEPLDIECRLRRADGEYRWHLCRARPMRSPDGDVTMWIGSATDIEDVKRTAERKRQLELTTAALREQRRQLLALNNAKDEFISLASHQLRTPATGVKQYIGMMLEGYAGRLSKQQKAFLQKAYDSNEREIVIINDLLQVAQVDAGKVTLRKQPTDVVALVEDVLREQEASFAVKQQTMIYDRAAGSLPANIDAERIRMVIENIIDNASKYTPNGKSITITSYAENSNVHIAISDQGVGIEQHDIDKVFQKFSRLHNPLSLSVDGTGLGLYWAKKIVDLHDGTIVVRSNPGEGSVFEIVLPQ